MCICMYIYIYMCREIEREREREIIHHTPVWACAGGCEARAQGRLRRKLGNSQSVPISSIPNSAFEARVAQLAGNKSSLALKHGRVS